MEFLYFTLIAMGLYVVADLVLDRIEHARGARFAESRQLVFFGIILTLALPTFWLIQLFTKAA